MDKERQASRGEDGDGGKNTADTVRKGLENISKEIRDLKTELKKRL